MGTFLCLIVIDNRFTKNARFGSCHQLNCEFLGDKSCVSFILVWSCPVQAEPFLRCPINSPRLTESVTYAAVIMVNWAWSFWIEVFYGDICAKRCHIVMWSHRVIWEGWMHDAGNRKRIGLLRDGKCLTWQKAWLGFSTDSPKIWHPGILDILRWRHLRNSGSRKGTLTSLTLPFFPKKVHETPMWKVPSLHQEGTPSYLQSQGVWGLRNWCQ